MRAFRFAIGSPLILAGPQLRETAKRAEDLGYSTFLFSDHFGQQLAAIPAAMAAAAATSTLRVGTSVLCNEFRHPAVVARDAATVDLLSDGRFELGLGAGWMRTEFEDHGFRYDESSVRVARLDSSLAIIRTLLQGGTVDHESPHYSLRAVSLPSMLASATPIPIMVGGGGSAVLEVAARHADIVSLAPLQRQHGPLDALSISLESTREKCSIVRARGRDPELNVYPVFSPAHVTESPDGALEDLHARVTSKYGYDVLTRRQLEESPHVLVGSKTQLVDKLLRIRSELGISYIRVGIESLVEFSPIVAELAGS